MEKELTVIKSNMRFAKGVSIVGCPIIFKLVKDGQIFLIEI